MTRPIDRRIHAAARRHLDQLDHARHVLSTIDYATLVWLLEQRAGRSPLRSTTGGGGSGPGDPTATAALNDDPDPADVHVDHFLDALDALAGWIDIADARHAWVEGNVPAVNLAARCVECGERKPIRSGGRSCEACRKHRQRAS